MSDEGRTDRRELLRRAGTVGMGAVLLGGAARLGHVPILGGPEELAAAATTCTLDPEVTEGPYWIANNLTRRDIREDRKGLLLDLRLTVRNSSTCAVISGADVEIWHADAAGDYSLNSERYLRGHQIANSNGLVRFFTIYPGWYRGRAPHIHLKVHVGGDTVHTGQLFFRDATSDTVYETRRYRLHGEPDTTNSEDSIYRQAGRSAALVALTRRGSRLAQGFVGRSTLAVRA
jgi:protocatechuate 3,4-dioxygenase beta subunit